MEPSLSPFTQPASPLKTATTQGSQGQLPQWVQEMWARGWARPCSSPAAQTAWQTGNGGGNTAWARPPEKQGPAGAFILLK